MDKARVRAACESKWKIKQLLGKGKEGSVYLACQKKLCVQVVKVIPLRKTDLKTLGTEFELQKVAARHHLAPKLDDAWICNGKQLPATEASVFVVSDLITGMNLFSTFQTFMAIEPEMIAKAWALLYETISELHKLGIVHRDLNPGNVMVELKKLDPIGFEPTSVKLIDFTMAGNVKQLDQKDIQTDIQNDWTDAMNYLFRLPPGKLPQDISKEEKALWNDIEKWKITKKSAPSIHDWMKWLMKWIEIDSALSHQQLSPKYNFENR